MSDPKQAGTVRLTPNRLLRRVLQDVMRCGASDNGRMLLLIPSWPRDPGPFCLFCGRPTWLQDQQTAQTSDSCIGLHRLSAGQFLTLKTACFFSGKRVSLLQRKMLVESLPSQKAGYPLCSMSSLSLSELRILHTPHFLFFPSKSCSFLFVRFHFNLFLKPHISKAIDAIHLFPNTYCMLREYFFA